MNECDAIIICEKILIQSNVACTTSKKGPGTWSQVVGSSTETTNPHGSEKSVPLLGRKAKMAKTISQSFKVIKARLSFGHLSNNYSIHSFIHSSIHPSVYPSTHPSTHQFNHSLTHSFVRSFVRSFVH